MRPGSIVLFVADISYYLNSIIGAEKEKALIKEKEVEKGEKVVRPLREPGEGPLEGAPPEDVPGAEEEGTPGEGAPPRSRADIDEDVKSHREGHEGIRGMGAGEGTVRPSTERRGSAELGRQHASGRNYRISDGDALEEGGEVAKFERNYCKVCENKETRKQTELWKEINNKSLTG